MTRQSSDDGLVADTAERIFRDLGRPPVRSAESTETLWHALQDAGLTRAWIPESCGGAGASMADGFEIVRIAASYAVKVPLVETLLASWLLVQGKLAAPDGKLTLAPCDVRDTLSLDESNTLCGIVRVVPFARSAEHLAVLAHRNREIHVALIDIAQCKIKAHDNVAQESRDVVTLSNATPLASARIDDATLPLKLQLLGATTRAVQMAGALQRVLDLSVAYANERIAFEKPIGKFQAVQHSLAKLAGEAAAALAAAGSAADSVAENLSKGNLPEDLAEEIFLEVASAKIRVGEAVATGAAIAHQVHGAIGFSQEHVLHRYTQRLWAWRDDFGSESLWAEKLGRQIARNGVDKLWPLLAAR